jgi:PrtD family type I secretion system ABC transporter
VSVQSPRQQQYAPVRAALASCRSALIGVAIFSGVVNVLMLTGPLFMLQIYDRVLSSRSVPTLVALVLLVIFLYGAQGLVDLVRTRVLVRVGERVDEALTGSAYRAVATLPLTGDRTGDGLQPVRDLDQIRQFMSGAGPLTVFDVPWIPVYLAVVFMIHFWLGIVAVLGAVLLFGFAILTDTSNRKSLKEFTAQAVLRNAMAEAGRTNAEVLRAMGMLGNFVERWREVNRRHLDANRKASDVVGGYGSASKVVRQLLQSLILALGAYLAIIDQITPGAMIAASIIAGRALAPVEQAITNWRQFVAARQSRQRLEQLLRLIDVQPQRMELPPPTQRLDLEALVVAPPGAARPVLQNVRARLNAGDGLGIIGPSASGKSCLARTIVGIWPPARGNVRIDGATLDQWYPERLGRHIGYMPQDVQLLDGSIGQNIARFHRDASAEAIVAAAQAAGAHEMILRMPQGYDTPIGEAGFKLSAGQRQRIGLARSLFGNPFLVVLDEPNSNLDSEGEAALGAAMRSVRARGGILVVIAHRPSALAAVDLVMVLGGGQMQAFGPKETVLNKVLQQPAVPMAVREGGVRAG